MLKIKSPARENWQGFFNSFIFLYADINNLEPLCLPLRYTPICRPIMI